MENNEISTELTEELTESSDTLTDTERASDVSELLSEDLKELKNEFSELAETSDITELHNPTRYAALRDMGLTPREAYLATSPARRDNRTHLTATPKISANRPASAMTGREWQVARSLFEDLSDAEIEKLYRKVTR